MYAEIALLVSIILLMNLRLFSSNKTPAVDMLLKYSLVMFSLGVASRIVELAVR